MPSRWRAWLGGEAKGEPGPREAAAATIRLRSGAELDFAGSIDPAAEFPVPRWDDLFAWIEGLPEAERDEGWEACERAWILRMRDALGDSFRLDEGATAFVVSSLDPRQARHALDFMERTRKRILHVLGGLAQPPVWGRDLLILFDDPDSYYRYASIYHPAEGEFALSSGMYISRDRGHFISTKADLAVIEPVIAHEMTHGCVAHLPLPLWLNEGLAVNTERRVAPGGMPLHTPAQMRARHLEFWGPEEVQEFWSGHSFRRHDDGNELSYDLARILVEHLSADWPRFAEFAKTADYRDGGARAAREHLRVDLGEAAAALFGAADSGAFAPDSSRWREAAEWIPEP